MGFLSRLFSFGSPPPEWAAFFSPAAWKAFKGVLRRHLRGLDTTFDWTGGRIVIRLPGQGETQAGLSNLAQVCHRSPEAEWPRIVSSHFSTLLGPNPDTEEAERLRGDFAAAREKLKVRIYPGAALAVMRESGPVVREIADGLAAVLVLDLEQTVRSVARDDVAGWNTPDEELFEIGLANVKAEGPLSSQRIPLEKGGHIDLLGSDSFFAASHVLFLENYLPPGNRHGALAAVPHRHAVLMHAIESLHAVVAVSTLASAAAGMHREGPGSISPDVYWWRPGRVLRIPAEVKGKEIRITPPAEFLDVLNGLPAPGPGGG